MNVTCHANVNNCSSLKSGQMYPALALFRVNGLVNSKLKQILELLDHRMSPTEPSPWECSGVDLNRFWVNQSVQLAKFIWNSLAQEALKMQLAVWKRIHSWKSKSNGKQLNWNNWIWISTGACQLEKGIHLSWWRCHWTNCTSNQGSD